MAQKLQEQVAHDYGVKQRRASAPQTHPQAPASRQYAGHSAGIHPEDTPYLTQGSQRRAVQPQVYDDEDEDDDDIYPQRPATSARRYVQPRQEVYTDGHRKIVVHRQPPQKQRSHWMLYPGIGLFVMVLGYLALSALGGWWQTKQDDWKYGTPRTFQIDQFVGHNDSPIHPNHFVAINLGGTIEVVEINTQLPKDDHIYGITTASDSATPVSIAFDDTNHDGKVDMLVTIGDSNPYTVVMLNTGSVFQH